ncbi:transglycosylase SLT domain-containing protein [Streptomyces sp. P17]|uniref:transglycosylase SLT domain-containing protein n=1 Tax=Streptomyces sp. P17 TaxID=3074716 RepID=UPI0028F41D8F|nr:transglycosylase SLT domain-containing protein [Streptomyces sp. P17]MDT9701643.1 transglycosylase SLT domain-containing protein [Streptomyces sp. P17]
MPKNFLTSGYRRALTRQHKIAVAGVATLGAAALAFSAVPGNAQTTTIAEPAAAQVAFKNEQIKDVKASVTDQAASASLKAEAIAAKKKAEADAAAAKKKAEAARKAAAEAAAKKKAEAARKAKEAASRSAARPQAKPVAAKKTYANNLDGWIKQALDIMGKNNIPGTYNGLYRNIMRESSGNPNAINNWDINAQNGVPSIGLLQVIKPTFDAYHVPGTAWSQYDPVANLTAAANYAADRYGSIDNVNSAY